MLVSICSQKLKPKDEWPEIYSKYTDDVVFHTLRTKEKVSDLTQVERYTPFTAITCEGEHEVLMPFLDIKAQRIAGSMVTSIHWKLKYTGLYTSWENTF